MGNIFWLINIFLNLFYVNSIYFHLYKDEKRCFYDEYYTDTVKIKNLKNLQIKGFTYSL